MHSDILLRVFKSANVRLIVITFESIAGNISSVPDRVRLRTGSVTFNRSSSTTKYLGWVTLTKRSSAVAGEASSVNASTSMVSLSSVSSNVRISWPVSMSMSKA